MSNPQDNKRPDQQNEKPRPGQQPPTESDSKPESRHGQGGREGHAYPKAGEQKSTKKKSTDEDSDDEGNR